MANEKAFPYEQPPKTLDQMLADMLVENERLHRQLQDAYHERDQYKMLYLDEFARTADQLTPQDIANSVPARPLIEQIIRELESP
jgi:predicted Zn-dependent peptidase